MRQKLSSLEIQITVKQFSKKRIYISLTSHEIVNI